MRHPIEKYNEQQAAVIAGLPEDQQAYMARMFRIGNAAYCYYNRARDLTVFDTNQSASQPTDLLEWIEQQLSAQKRNQAAEELLRIYWEEYLEGLPHEGLRQVEKEAGLDKAMNSLPFRRYVLERHDIGMDEYMRQNLSDEDYAYHVECGKSLDDSNKSIS